MAAFQPARSQGTTSGGFGGLQAHRASDLGLSFYTEPPTGEVSIRDFEVLAMDRMKVLHSFDRLGGYDVSMKKITELTNRIKPELVKANLVLSYPTTGNLPTFEKDKKDFIQRDVLSHFIVRLAFCKDRDAREWLVKQEQRLFTIRYEALSLEGKEAFLKKSGVPCVKFTPGQAGKPTEQEVYERLPDAKIFTNPGWEKETTFYELPFTALSPSLIAGRRVLLRQGRAFVPGSALKLILAGKLKDHLHHALDVAFQGLPAALADPRVGPFLRLLQDHGMQLIMGPKVSTDDLGERLTIQTFDEVLVRSFPPCMRRMVEKQRETRKRLKHQGKLQLRPFLKDCGFTLEDSARWWKNEICRDPEIDSAQFDKDFLYDIEHTYGRKGHFQGQNSFGCPKIINFPHEAGGQCHGCPMKGLEINGLKEQLHKWRVPEATMNEMEKLIKNGNHYQLACIEYFKATHPGHSGEGVGNSPNDFYRYSSEHYLKKKEAAAGGSPGKASSPLKA